MEMLPCYIDSDSTTLPLNLKTCCLDSPGGALSSMKK